MACPACPRRLVPAPRGAGRDASGSQDVSLRGGLFLLLPLGEQARAFFFPGPLGRGGGFGFDAPALGALVGGQRLGLDAATLRLAPAGLFLPRTLGDRFRLDAEPLRFALARGSGFDLNPALFCSPLSFGRQLGLEPAPLFLGRAIGFRGGFHGDSMPLFFLQALRVAAFGVASLGRQTDRFLGAFGSQPFGFAALRRQALLFSCAFGGLALFLSCAFGGGSRFHGETRALLFAGPRLGDGDFSLETKALLLAGAVGGGARERLQALSLLDAGILDRFGRFLRQPSAFLFPYPHHGDCRLGFHAAALFDAGVLRGARGGSLEPGPFLSARALHRLRCGGGEPGALFLAGPGRGRGRFGLEPSSYFFLCLLGRSGCDGGQPDPFFLARMIRSRRGLGGDSRPFFFTGTGGRSSRFRVHAPPFFRPRLLGRGGSRGLETRPFLVARPLDNLGHGCFGFEPRPFLVARARGRSRGLRLQPPDVLEPLAFRSLRLGLCFLAPQGLEQRAFRRSLGFRLHAFGFETVIFSFTLQAGGAFAPDGSLRLQVFQTQALLALLRRRQRSVFNGRLRLARDDRRRLGARLGARLPREWIGPAR